MTIQNSQVLQRGPDNTATVTLENGETLTLPVGGPYTVGDAHNVYVGDLWILAGQSNMEGVGDLTDTEMPAPGVHSFQSIEQWAVAQEPLHWLGESPRLVHHVIGGGTQVPETTPTRDPNRNKGAGLGLTFAKIRYAQNGVPIGLIPSAHGGTSMAQWNPALKGEGGASLYGATLERVKANGGKVAGILWYQGESDCNPADLAVYEQRMIALINAFRADFGQPDLPFYYVQLSGFAADGDPSNWNGIREAQRTLQSKLPNIGMASAIDLGLDDLIHVGTKDFKRLGKRLAALAEGHPAPDLVSVTNEGYTLRVQYQNVRGGLRSQGRPTGFSLRHADGTEALLIYKIVLEGDTATLKMQEPLPANSGLSLWYGWGHLPYVNITDAEDAALPAFGPLAL